MCLISFAYKVHPLYKLVLVANRDEFYERPTRKAQFWKKEKHPNLLAGKDLKANGTWLGITTSGKWGALTNYRDPTKIRENPPSRGNLVLNYLIQNTNPSTYLNEIRSNSTQFNGFNLLVGTLDALFHYSNIENKITQVTPGIHGVSNALFNTSWPKLDEAKKALHDVIKHQTLNTAALFDILKNEQKPPVGQLPKTGIPMEWEKAVSSIFIKTENYGTRCSTVLLIDNNNLGTFIEHRYEPNTGSILEENTFKLVFS